MADNKKKSNKLGNILFYFLVFLLVILPILKTRQAGDSLILMLPNALLFTGFRDQARDLWSKLVVVNKGVKRAPKHIPEIQAKDYSFEALREATDNWYVI